MKTRNFLIVASMSVFATLFTVDADGRLAKLALRGPPTICFKIDIGDARTIPDDGESAKLAGAEYHKAVVAVLEESDDALVHMETLRRAFFIAENEKERIALLERLEDRVLAAEVNEEQSGKKRRALAWFDLGYWRRILEEGQGFERDSAHPYIDKSLRIVGDDAGTRLGAACASVDSMSGTKRYLENIAAAHRLATDPKSLVARHLVATVERFTPELAADGYAKIGARATAKVP